MIFVGVDPGVTGAIALLCSRRGLLEVADIPTEPNGQESGRMMRWVDAAGLRKILEGWSAGLAMAEDRMAFIERPIAMPNLPAQTIASQFDTFGVLRSELRRFVAPQPVQFPNPRDWKAKFGLKADKDEARSIAERLYHDAPVKRAKDHNRAEAILIAHYGMREVMG